MAVRRHNGQELGIKIPGPLRDNLTAGKVLPSPNGLGTYFKDLAHSGSHTGGLPPVRRGGKWGLGKPDNDSIPLPLPE